MALLQLLLHFNQWSITAILSTSKAATAILVTVITNMVVPYSF
uniref:Uncharacterized protein n=1 Tax=Myoviridae sp. ctijX18 TaxID=2825154 RepID=A0A8S5USJ0_9CAUD|nr:MAG TPA: hypothetical protein [Myoviridae sp. ctijX18]DAJ69067.1 MAG TPA: hypothetical protein [Caudoviricetes sp.]